MYPENKSNNNAPIESINSRRQLILGLLDLEPRLTAHQIATLAYPSASEVRNGKLYPKTYNAANKMLRRMVEDKLLKIQSYPALLVPDFFMLPSTEKLKGFDKSKHERGGGDLFVAFYPILKQFSESGVFSAWSFEPSVGSMRADRGLKIDQITYYIEVDRCTEGVKKIRGKVENYIEYQKESNHRFRVIFTLLSDDENKIALRGDKLTRLFEEYGRGNMFTACNHHNLVSNPLADVLYSWRDGQISIKNL